MTKCKFILEKETEWKESGLQTWYYIKCLEDDNMTIVGLTLNDEVRANTLFEAAVSSYVKPSKEIIKEIII